LDVETEADAMKVLAMAEAAWNGRTIKPHRIGSTQKSESSDEV
jgi:hypothetical protein